MILIFKGEVIIIIKSILLLHMHNIKYQEYMSTWLVNYMFDGHVNINKGKTYS